MKAINQKALRDSFKYFHKVFKSGFMTFPEYEIKNS